MRNPFLKLESQAIKRSFPVRVGIVHFVLMFVSALYKSFNNASSDRNNPRFMGLLGKIKLTVSIALMV